MLELELLVVIMHQEDLTRQISKEMFLPINEDRFSVVYSDNSAARTNDSVNVYIRLLML